MLNTQRYCSVIVVCQYEREYDINQSTEPVVVIVFTLEYVTHLFSKKTILYVITGTNYYKLQSTLFRSKPLYPITCNRISGRL